MNAAAAYVGVEPEGLRLLASSLDSAEADLTYCTARIDALLAEAGESVDMPHALRNLADDWNVASADIRGRAAIAEDLAALAATPYCEVPWWDPLRRAALAVRNNAWQFGSGTFDSLSQAGSTIWRLTPINGEWRQEWVDLRVGFEAARENPAGTLEAMAGYDTLEAEGWSYWLGGVVPDLILSAFGGAGLVNRGVRTADTAAAIADAAEAGGRLNHMATASAVVTRRGIVEGDGALSPTRLTLDLFIERDAKAEVLALDARVRGHHAAKHGVQTTLDQHYRRAMTGVNPDGTRGPRPENSSRFLWWQDQHDAIVRAVEMWDGEAKEVTVPFEHIIGEGFMKRTGQYRETTVATVKFSTRGEPYTSFPELKKGL